MDAAACADATITPIRYVVPAQETLAATTNSAAQRIVAVHDIVPAQEMLQAMEERMGKTTERLQGHISMMESKIHRFPRGLRRIGGQDDSYIVPSVVAIGPYHHGLEHLQDMEEVKHAAAHHLCMESGHPVEVVFGKILSVAGDARRCYAATDAAVARLSDAEFAVMMFLDGCFLLQYMVDRNAPLFLGCTLLSGPSILKDMMLLENQIPWLVLEALAEFMPVDVPVRGFVAAMGDRFFPKKEIKKGLFLMKCRSVPPATDERSGRSNSSYKNYKPPHLLGLLRFNQICSMPGDVLKYQAGASSLSSSALELAQMGVKLTASTATWFGDMDVKKTSVCGELSLSPLFLNDVTACWLVNMAALEASTASSWSSDGFVVSSYLSVLAMLMDRKEDVHELRVRRVLSSVFSNTQTLAFFKGLAQHLRFGGRYFVVLEQIDSYKRNRPVRIVANKFVYKHYKTIATILSITGVLVGIFKALLSLKQH